MTRENEGRTALVELSFAFMGLLKLLGLEWRLFKRWGMSPDMMRAIGVIETGGALLVANGQTRQLGAAGLAGLSAIMLALELRNGEAELVLPRLALTTLALQTAYAKRSPAGRA